MNLATKTMNKNAHILVVDDEPDTVEILSRQLGLENYKILKAYSGQESLELLKKHKPDLILMDITMPGMDGFETIRVIRDTVKEFIPIIIVTASKDDTENITRGFAVGANDYIVIPCHKEELLARIKAMLRIKELHDALRANEERLDRVNRCLLSLGPDFNANVGGITALCGELLNGTCALYNRIKGDMLCAVGQWHTPPDFEPKDTPEGHICYDVIGGAAGDLLFVPDLLHTRYADTDPNVRRYGLQSYLGYPVHCGSEIVGSLCVVFQQSFVPTENDKRLMSILASALSVEESRYLAEQKLRRDITERKRAEMLLYERVKELDCLYGLSILMGRYDIALDEIFRGTVELIPPALQHPDITGARIVMQDRKFQTENFHKTAWMQAHDIVVYGKSVGRVEVCYLKPTKTDEPTLLKEEDRLLNIIAERLGRVVERKRAEEALKESEAKHKTLFTGAAEGILVADLQTKQFHYANPALCRMFGYTEAELLRLRVADIHPQESLNHVLAEFEAQTRGEKTMVSDIPCLRKDGTLFYANISGVVMVLDGHHCNVGFFTDITEHKKAKEALLFKTMLLEAQSETSIDGILAVDDEGHTILFNKRFGEMWKIPQNILDTKDDKRMLEYVLKQLKNPAEFNRKVAYLYEHKDEKSRDEIEFADGRCLDRYSSPLTSADGKHHGRIWYFRDITERKLMQEKLLTSEKLAVMGRLTADMSHELNNPLAIVIGGSQLMLSRLGKKASPFKSQLETVLRNARRCKSVISNLLGYSRTIGKKEEAINLPNLIREAIDDVNYQYDMSGVEIMLNYDKMANVKIAGNCTALLSVFVNLIRNARQAMGEKGRLTVTIEKEDAKHLRIEIHDTGIGMNKEQKTKLFKPFASGWKEKEGSGLGLATSLGIIETHGGSMSAESAGIGKGAAFTILLPCEFKRKK